MILIKTSTNFPYKTHKNMRHSSKSPEFRETSELFPSKSRLFLTNNFEFRKNLTQKQFFSQEFYRSRSKLLNLSQKTAELHENLQYLSNRVSFLRKEREKSRKRAKTAETQIGSLISLQKSRFFEKMAKKQAISFISGKNMLFLSFFRRNCKKPKNCVRNREKFVIQTKNHEIAIFFEKTCCFREIAMTRSSHARDLCIFREFPKRNARKK